MCKVLLVCACVPAFAADDWLKQELLIYRAAKTAREYVLNSKMIHRSERAALLAHTPKDAALPPIQLVRDPFLTFVSGSLRVELTDPAKRIITVNNQPVTVPPMAKTAQLAALFLKYAPAKKEARWSPFPEAHADSDNINTGCLSYWRDSIAPWYQTPHTVLDSNLGYIPHLWIAGMVLEGIERKAPLIYDTCKHQIRTLRKMMAQSHIALKEIDCDTEFAGRDRAMTFWLPEFESAKQLKTREFDLDYTRGLVSEGEIDKQKDDDDEDKEEISPETVAATAEAVKKKTYRLYDFGNEELNAAHDLKSVDGRNKCVDYEPGTPEFDRVKREIEPFREVFHYVGANQTCTRCGREIKTFLATPTAPKDLRQLAAARVKEATLHQESDSAK